MNQFEVHCDFCEPEQFGNFDEAKAMAHKLCAESGEPVWVLRLVGTYVRSTQWLSGDVPEEK